MKAKRVFSLAVAGLLLLAMVFVPASGKYVGWIDIIGEAATFNEGYVYCSFAHADAAANKNNNTLALAQPTTGNDIYRLTVALNGYYGFILVGGDGGTRSASYPGGYGAVVAAYIYLSAGDSISVQLGRGGRNNGTPPNDGTTFTGAWSVGGRGGGSTYWGSGGGGYSSVWLTVHSGGSAYIAFAGGGGGSGWTDVTNSGYNGGRAGDLTSANYTNTYANGFSWGYRGNDQAWNQASNGIHGGSGTNTTGGGGGTTGGSAGTQYNGGNSGAGGGGGAGYYGGGGGYGTQIYGAGGGGCSWINDN